MSESMSYELSQKLDQRGYEGQMALGYLDAINDLMKIEDRRYRDQSHFSKNQQIVFDWLQKKCSFANSTWFHPFEAIMELTVGLESGELEVVYSISGLSYEQQVAVLQAFSLWALEQEQANEN